ncbi:uncharacterized protein BKA55DRAFT_685346 [Fusarium redolens]|uniref:Uncharacterized protein n=1 Tax=Fusarium redolens TaxID=48865 RepID=A0A9P9HX41_FUSRE|nr:uncharacterized protein BKA55DRAFT_685346 [Fusarium redolens]KAH7264861.1 hypothetical protein BKA55DRAFT_685346 [Fusarium redolens]
MLDLDTFQLSTSPWRKISTKQLHTLRNHYQINPVITEKFNMCTQTENVEECSRCGYTTAILDPIEDCGLRSPQSFGGPKMNCYVGRCFGVAFTSYVDAVICQTCVAKEERDCIRRNNKKAAQVFEK